ncbi:hypothetical protein SANTM175S_01829 [Streptomyces antimycoticus]
MVFGTREVTSRRGTTVTLDFVHSWTMRDGKAARMEDIFDTVAFHELIELTETDKPRRPSAPAPRRYGSGRPLFRNASAPGVPSAMKPRKVLLLLLHAGRMVPVQSLMAELWATIRRVPG